MLIEFDSAATVRVDEWNPVVAWVRGFDGGAIGTVDKSLGLESGAAVIDCIARMAMMSSASTLSISMHFTGKYSRNSSLIWL